MDSLIQFYFILATLIFNDMDSAHAPNNIHIVLVKSKCM